MNNSKIPENAGCNADNTKELIAARNAITQLVKALARKLAKEDFEQDIQTKESQK